MGQHDSSIFVEDAALRQGFTQIPNVVLRDKDLSTGAKLAYATLLSYAWNDNAAFPGQERMAEDMGVGVRSVVRYIQELQEQSWIDVQRRGLGMTNVYVLKSLVQRLR